MFNSCEQTAKLPEGVYKITGEASGVYNGIRVYLKEKVMNRGRSRYVIKDTAIVINEMFEFKGTYDNEVLWYLEGNSMKGMLPLVINNDLTQIKINKDTLDQSVISNSKSNQLIANHEKQRKLLLKRRGELFKAYRNNINKSNTFKVEFGMTMKNVADSINSMDRIFVEKNPDNCYSLNLLKKLISTKAPIKEVKALFENINPKIQNSPEGLSLKTEIETEFAKFIAKEAVSVGKTAPEFKAKNPNDDFISLNEVKGKYTLIDFWAAWCRPCRVENPNLLKAYNKYHSKGFEIISVSFDGRRGKTEGKKAWTEAIEKDGIGSWPHVSNLSYFNGPIAKGYGVTSIPSSFLIDENGKIIAKNLRGEALQKKLESLF
jgi:peroxiredoxin